MICIIRKEEGFSPFYIYKYLGENDIEYIVVGKYTGTLYLYKIFMGGRKLYKVDINDIIFNLGLSKDKECDNLLESFLKIIYNEIEQGENKGEFWELVE